MYIESSISWRGCSEKNGEETTRSAAYTHGGRLPQHIQRAKDKKSVVQPPEVQIVLTRRMPSFRVSLSPFYSCLRTRLKWPRPFSSEREMQGTKDREKRRSARARAKSWNNVFPLSFCFPASGPYFVRVNFFKARCATLFYFIDRPLTKLLFYERHDGFFSWN